MAYTEHEKVGFVERMWAEGLRPTSAQRLWGAPNRNLLTKWEREALAGELPAKRPPQRGRAEHRKHARWPEETKAEAIRLADLGVPCRQIGERLGLPRGKAAGLVKSWRAQRERARMAAEGAVDVKSSGKGRAKAPARAELEERVAELELDNAALRELIADPKAGAPASLSNRLKAGYVTRLRGEFGFRPKDLLAFFRMSRSSYEYACRERGRAEPDGLAERVSRAFEASGGTYGHRRVRAPIESGADGEPPAPAPERAVRRIMRERGLAACRRRGSRPWSSYPGEPEGGRPANLPRERARARREAGEDFRLAHDFSAAGPGELLVTDVTEFSVGGRKLFLSPVTDCWDGAPISWRVSAHPDSALCGGSLADALASLPAGHGPTAVHTDGGACCGARSWKALCSEHGAERSMSRKGACPDNARAEGLFGALKREFLHPRDWGGVGAAEFARELDGYLRWFVDGRLRAFREGGRTVYMTIAEHRRLHGYAAP